MAFKNRIFYFCIIFNIIELLYCKIIVINTDINTIVGKFHDVNSLFGSYFEDGTRGFLIESVPMLACNKTIERPPLDLTNSSNVMFFSLIRRGNCTFEHKVRAAQNSGYNGVIIYNNNSDRIFPMPKPRHSTDDPIHIPSRMVGRTSGYRLRNYTFTQSRNNFIVVFHKDFDFNPQCYIIAFLAFVSFGFLLIGVVFAIKLCREYIKRRGNRLKKGHLKKIPVKKFVKGVDTFEVCAICLDDFQDSDKIRILLCNHAYHIKCIDPWLLKQKRNCPVCKSRVKIPGRIEESDDNISAITSPEHNNSTVDEHTPLINTRDNSTTQFYFGNNDNEVNFTSEQSKSVAQNSYVNQCIDCSGTTTPIIDPIVIISSHNARELTTNTDDFDPTLQLTLTKNV